MASRNPVKDLCEEASCSICLDFFQDPVTIAECGHSFCRACLTRSWGESGAKPSCPQCRRRAQPKSLRPNLQLANFVEITKKLTLQEGREAGAKEGVCQKHLKPLEFFCKGEEAPLCILCVMSKEHRDHEVVPLEEAAREYKAVMVARKGRVCQKHQEPLKLFCKDDEALICVVCARSKEHRNHETLPIEEASQEYKDQFCSYLEILKKERERIVAYKGDVERESQDLLKQTKEKKRNTVAKFRQLHTFLEEQEKLLLAQIEEVEEDVARNREQHLAKLSEELSSLESLIRELEEKCQQPASELLQVARSILQRYKEKESFENPAAFPLAPMWQMWDFSDLNLLLEGIKKQFRDSGLHLLKDNSTKHACSSKKAPLCHANVTLDPDTAHPLLIVSETRKSVRLGNKPQALPNNPERFDQNYIVLGHEGFTGGHYFWEVLVGNEEGWAVGVARKSVRRKGGDITYSPEGGIWAVGKWGGGYKACVDGHQPPLTVRRDLKRIQVCLNYAEGQVAFFDTDREALLYTYLGASFSGETLLPFFWVYKKGHLKIAS